MALLLLSSNARAKVPDWAINNSTKLNGTVLTTVCNGVGPSLETAKNEALKSCQGTASQYFSSKIKIKSVSVETEKSVGFHQEISSEEVIDGLNCEPQRDQINESESQFNVWLECKFDLKKISKGKVEEESEVPNNTHLNTLEPSKIKSTEDIQGKYVFISTVPKCETVIIKGFTSRVIQCSQNPLKIQIKIGDEELLIRANGYKPKTIKIKGVNSDETIQVLLDLL